MINSYRLAKLLRARIIRINQDRKRKIAVKSVAVYQALIEQYFRVCFKQAIVTGEAIIFPFVGNIQVLEKISKKGYKWDRQYNGKDYELVIHTKKDVNIKTDEKWYREIMFSVDRGVQFRNQVVNTSERLDEILSLMNERKVISKNRNRRVKITA